MREHPIEGLMQTSMNNIQNMIDVNTIIGDPIEANNTLVIPISKVSFGFAAGGSEFNEETIDEYNKKDKEEQVLYKLPFGGGSGAGVSINPVAFIIIQEKNVKLLPINHLSTVDKLLDYIPDLFEKISCVINKSVNEKEEKEFKNEVKENKKEYARKNEDNKSKQDTFKLENDEIYDD